jgi:hypothetical protein
MKAKLVNEVQNFERGKDPKSVLDIGIGNKLRIEGIDALTHFLYYAAYNFVEKAWKGNYLVDHLKEKLTRNVNGPGGGKMNPNALMAFIRDVDTENQEILYKYILDNHMDKW